MDIEPNDRAAIARAIAAMIVDRAIRATVYDASEWNSHAAYSHIFIGDAARRGDARVTLEQNDNLVGQDNRHPTNYTRTGRTP